MELKCFSQSTPESEFDDFWKQTHPRGTASWEDDDVTEEEDEDDLPDFDKDI